MRARDVVSVGLGLAGLGIAVFAIGSADRWAQALVAICAAGALAPQIVSRRVLDRSSPLIVLPLLAVALCIAQLIPLPHTILELIDPVGNGLRDDGSELMGLHPWHAASLDAPATLRSACFFVVLLVVAVVALRAAVTERGRYRLLACVAGTCGLVAIIVGIHELFGLTKLYGLYSLKEAKPSVLGPLLNENHLGCLMALGTTVGIGLVFYRRQSSLLRSAWLLVVAACGATTAASQSRGATLSLLLGIGVVLGIRLAQRISNRDAARGHKRRFSITSLPVILVAASAVIVVIYASSGGVTDQLSRTTLTIETTHTKSKFVAWKSSTELVEEAPWLGIGRGALEPVFTRVHPASALATYSHLENEYVQAVVDWGVVGSFLLGIALVWLLLVAARRWRDGPLTAGAIGGVLVVMVQSNVDFGVELLGVAVPVTIVAATLAYVPLVDGERRRAVIGRLSRAMLCAAALLAALLLFTSPTTTLAEDHADHSFATLPDIRDELDRHPLDYYGYAMASELMARSGNNNSIRLLNHALLLHPTHPGLHIKAARLLLAAGHADQATVEYATALRGTVEPQKLLVEIERLPIQQAANSIPTDYYKFDDLIATLTEQGHRDIALLVLYHQLARGPTSHLCDQLYALALQLNDVVTAKKALAQCPGFEPSTGDRLLLANMLLAQHANDDAILLVADVESWEGRVDQKLGAWLTLCDAYAAKAQWNETRRCLHRLESSGLVDDAHGNEIVRRLDAVNKADSAFLR